MHDEKIEVSRKVVSPLGWRHAKNDLGDNTTTQKVEVGFNTRFGVLGPIALFLVTA